MQRSKRFHQMTLSDFKTTVRLTFAHLRQHPGRMILTLLSVVTAAAIVVWVVSGYDSLVAKFDGFGDNYLGRYKLLIVSANAHGESGFGNARAKPLDSKILKELANDPAIAALDPVLQTRADIRASNPRPVSEDSNNERRRGSGRRPPSANEAADAGGKGGADKSPESSKATDTKQEPSRRAPGAVIYHTTPIIGGGGGGIRSGGPMLVGTDASEPPYRLIEGRWYDPSKPAAEEAAISQVCSRATWSQTRRYCDSPCWLCQLRQR
jgi:putative ABC transport system permease protein